MKKLEYYGEKFDVKSCPCCGGEAKLDTVGDSNTVLRVYITCDNCGLRTRPIPVAPQYSAIGVAVNFWNKRVKKEEK